MLLYRGPARDFLDLAVWVSCDALERPTLAELMAEESSDFEVRETLAQFTPGVGAVPGATGAETALALSAVLVNVGKLLRRDGGAVIGSTAARCWPTSASARAATRPRARSASKTSPSPSPSRCSDTSCD